MATYMLLSTLLAWRPATRATFDAVDMRGRAPSLVRAPPLVMLEAMGPQVRLQPLSRTCSRQFPPPSGSSPASVQLC